MASITKEKLKKKVIRTYCSKRKESNGKKTLKKTLKKHAQSKKLIKSMKSNKTDKTNNSNKTDKTNAINYPNNERNNNKNFDKLLTLKEVPIIYEDTDSDEQDNYSYNHSHNHSIKNVPNVLKIPLKDIEIHDQIILKIDPNTIK